MKFMNAKYLTVIFALSLTGCIESSHPVNLTHNSTDHKILSRTTSERFVKAMSDNKFRDKNGVTLDLFLKNASVLYPDYVGVETATEKSDLSRIWASINSSGIQEVSRVQVLHSTPRPGKNSTVKVEIVYFLYQLSDCSKINNPRKIDSTQLTSPGFGCAVERNRLLSLSNPEDWQLGRQGTAPNSARDVKAVQDYSRQAPRQFSPVSD